MEFLLVLLPMVVIFIPIFIVFVVYAAVIALAIWFIITFLNNQKVRNQLLAEISSQLKQKETSNDKEEVEEFQNDFVSETTDIERESDIEE